MRAAGWLCWERSQTWVRVTPPGWLWARAERMSVASGLAVLWASAQVALRAA